MVLWCHNMITLSALLALCVGIHYFQHKEPAMQSFGGLFLFSFVTNIPVIGDTKDWAEWKRLVKLAYSRLVMDFQASLKPLERQRLW